MYIQRSSVLSECTTEVICTLRMYIQRSSVLSEYTYRDHLYSQEGYIQRSSVLSECTYRGHLYYQNVLEVIWSPRMYIQRSSVRSECTYRGHLYSQKRYIQRSYVLSECTYRGHLYSQKVIFCFCTVLLPSPPEAKGGACPDGGLAHPPQVPGSRDPVPHPTPSHDLPLPNRQQYSKTDL
jgi:hypothetical protein